MAAVRRFVDANINRNRNQQYTPKRALIVVKITKQIKKVFENPESIVSPVKMLSMILKISVPLRKSFNINDIKRPAADGVK